MALPKLNAKISFAYCGFVSRRRGGPAAASGEKNLAWRQLPESEPLGMTRLGIESEEPKNPKSIFLTSEIQFFALNFVFGGLWRHFENSWPRYVLDR